MRSLRVAGWLTAVVIACAVGVASSAVAEDADGPTCAESCIEAEDLCLEGCQDSDDLDACEAACVASSEACIEECE